MALGIGNSVTGLASILNVMLSSYLADLFGVSFALWLAAFACGGSVVAALVLIPIDRSARSVSASILPNGQPTVAVPAKPVSIWDIKHFGYVHLLLYYHILNFMPTRHHCMLDSTVYWLVLFISVTVWGGIVPFQNVSASVLMERDYFREPPVECRRCGEGNYASYTDCLEIVPTCPEFLPYAWPLPRLSASCKIERSIDQLYCDTEPPFIKDSDINCENEIWKNGPKTQLYCEKKVEAEMQASHVMSLPSVISLFASPLFGYAVDHAGNRSLIVVGSVIFILLSQILIAITHFQIWWILAIQGMASCLYFATVWPTIPCKALQIAVPRLITGVGFTKVECASSDVVEEHHVGTAYGAIIAIGVREAYSSKACKSEMCFHEFVLLNRRTWVWPHCP